MKRLLLVDGNNLVMRYASVPMFQRFTYKGEPTGAIHGSVKGIIDAWDKYKPDEIAVIFDGEGAKEIKRKIYSGYKANRVKQTDSIAGQMEYTRAVLKTAGIYVYHQMSKDADDVIGSFSRLKRNVLIMSNDKDFSSLVSTRVCLIQKDIVKVNDVVNRYQVHPKRFAEYLALVGDSVDGIPGLTGCGPKNAVMILEYCKTWEDVLNNPPDAWKERIKKQRALLKKFYRLCIINKEAVDKDTIKRSIPLLTPQPISKDLFQLLQLRGLKALETIFRGRRSLAIENGILNSLN